MHDDSRNNKIEGLTRLTRQDTVLLDGNFNTNHCHILREIRRKFDRVSSVKRTSLYFKSRARPAIKHTSIFQHHHNSDRAPNYNKWPTEHKFHNTINSINTISKYEYFIKTFVK